MHPSKFKPLASGIAGVLTNMALSSVLPVMMFCYGDFSKAKKPLAAAITLAPISTLAATSTLKTDNPATEEPSKTG
jgi:hypothetical protein